MKQLFYFFIALLPLTASSQGFREKSDYVYGRYGLHSYPIKSMYSKYIGKVFTFLPVTPMLEEEEWLDFVGEPGKQYEIVDISTNDEGTDEMDVYVYYKAFDADSKKKARTHKCKIKNYKQMTSIWQVPFVFMDDVNDEIKNAIGKKFTRNDAENTYEIIDAKFEKYEEIDEHPCIVYYIKDSHSGMTFRAVDMDRDYSFIDKTCFFKWNKSTLVRVEQPNNNREQYGDIKKDVFQGTLVYKYSDSIVDIVLYPYESKDYMYPYEAVSDTRYYANCYKYKFLRNELRQEAEERERIFTNSRISPNSFLFGLKNKSDNTLKIIWDEAAYVGIDGQTSSIMHTGTKFSRKEESQMPSKIIRGASISDILLPTELVKLEEWERYSAYYESTTTKSQWVAYPLYDNSKPYEEPLTMRVMLPIQIKDVVNEYFFEFEVKSTYTFPLTELKK